MIIIVQRNSTMRMLKNSILFLLLCFFAGCQNMEEKEEINDVKAIQQVEDTIASSPQRTETLSMAGAVCYEQKFGEKGRANVFRVSILEKGDDITGLLEYLFYGEPPIAGSIIGKKINQDEIRVLYNYALDGKPQYQKVYFKRTKNSLLQKSGELIEKDGVMDLKDKNAPYTDTFLLVPCTASFI